MWKVGETFDNRLNGYPITRDGLLVAIAVYSGGTEPARKNAEQIVAAMNRKPDPGIYARMCPEDTEG